MSWPERTASRIFDFFRNAFCRIAAYRCARLSPRGKTIRCELGGLSGGIRRNSRYVETMLHLFLSIGCTTPCDSCRDLPRAGQVIGKLSREPVPYAGVSEQPDVPVSTGVIENPDAPETGRGIR